jgi:hypothetical protein
LKIFNIFFKEKKKQGFFAKIISPQKIDEMELDKAKLYYSDLKITTKELLKMLATSERRLEAMNETKFH